MSSIKYRNLYVAKKVGLNTEFVFAGDEDVSAYRRLSRDEVSMVADGRMSLWVFKRSDPTLLWVHTFLHLPNRVRCEDLHYESR